MWIAEDTPLKVQWRWRNACQLQGTGFRANRLHKETISSRELPAACTSWAGLRAALAGIIYIDRTPQSRGNHTRRAESPATFVAAPRVRQPIAAMCLPLCTWQSPKYCVGCNKAHGRQPVTRSISCRRRGTAEAEALVPRCRRSPGVGAARPQTLPTAILFPVYTCTCRLPGSVGSLRRTSHTPHDVITWPLSVITQFKCHFQLA